MIRRATGFAVFIYTVLVLFGGSALSGSSLGELARESERKMTATAKTRPTPQMVMDKVDQAATLIKKEGPAAFPKFKGKDSPFIFAGTYIWILDEGGVVRMHPIKYKLEGKRLISLRDSRGKRFVAAMKRKASEHGSGWVDYWWPKAGAKTPAQHVSYVKRVHVGGKMFVVGCGVSDMSKEDFATLPK
ncbi:MAG: cache domain-containing protein [Deltaproteobacteria bacterium]|nr:cache domain-containing protein [Deltaproteobacteria bacterium]